MASILFTQGGVYKTGDQSVFGRRRSLLVGQRTGRAAKGWSFFPFLFVSPSIFGDRKTTDQERPFLFGFV